jgi:hypothetical protein
VAVGAALAAAGGEVWKAYRLQTVPPAAQPSGSSSASTFVDRKDKPDAAQPQSPPPK